MEESVLIKTFDMIIDQLNKLSTKSDMLEEYFKHESRHKIKNEIIYGKIFGYPFNLTNYDWLPSCRYGHIKIDLKENRLRDIWFTMWNDNNLNDEDKIIAEDMKSYIRTFIKDYDDFEKKMIEYIDESDESDTITYNLCESYGIDTLYKYIEDYVISSYVLKNIESPYITYYSQTYNQINYIKKENYKYKNPHSYIQEFKGNKDHDYHHKQA